MSRRKNEPNGPRAGHPVHIPTGTREVMTFYPSWEEFADFPAFIKKIEQSGAHLKSGICKIVPPPGWVPHKNRRYTDIDDLKIYNPVKETIEAQGIPGVYLKGGSTYRKEMTVKEFRKLAKSVKFKNPKPELDGKEMEDYYWKNVVLGEPIYGADTEGSVYDEGVDEFNMKKGLGTILDEVEGQIHGVNTVYLYFGMYKTTFAWHTEDMELYSINYLHYGAPKYWYAISSESAERFERTMSQLYPGVGDRCKAFLRHKHHLISPSVLREKNIPFGTMIQRQNEFIITFPRGYHAGFNSGYNCAESTNFASDRWIDFGKNATICRCRKDKVEIDMRPYMYKYRAEEAPAWENYWYGVRKVNVPMAGSANCRKRKSGNGPRASVCGATSLQPGVVGAGGTGGTVGAMVGGWRENKKWRQALEGMWSRGAVNLYAERQWNASAAREGPHHCAVCQYLMPKPLQEKVAVGAVPKRSPRLLHAWDFAKQPRPAGSAGVVEEVDDVLLTCQHCEVTVHAGCYSTETRVSGGKGGVWRCDRCSNRDDAAVRHTSCVLCELRGGALVRCLEGEDGDAWVHVICALLNRRALFVDPSRRSLVIHNSAPKHGNPRKTRLSLEYVCAVPSILESARFECEVCGGTREGLLQCVACDECPQPALVHATCARAVGMLIERRNYPLSTVVVCDRHVREDDDDEERLPVLSAGDSVIAWLDDGVDVCEARVIEREQNTYAMVDFLDGTTSRNTPVDEVGGCNCLQCDMHTHQYGAAVCVRWSDGSEYPAYFRRLVTERNYLVRTVDGREERVGRGVLYGKNDALPAEVKRKLAKKSRSG